MPQLDGTKSRCSESAMMANRSNHHQRGVFLCGIPANRSVIQDIERNCSTSGGLGMRSTKAISLAWDSAIGYVWVAIAARLESLVK